MPKLSDEIMDADSLDKAAAHVELLCASLRSVAGVMRSHSIDTMLVTQHKALIRCMEDLNRFAAAARDAVTKRLLDDGEFRAGSDR